MLREFFIAGTFCHVAFAWGGLLTFVAHGVFKAWLKWALNGWYSRFYDGLQDLADGSGEMDEEEHLAAKRDEVFNNLVEFAWIVAPAVVVHPVAKWVASVWRFNWRLALVRSYLAHYDVNAPPIEGTAQRIHEDTQRFEAGLYTCFTMVLDSVLTLAIFIPLLLEVGARAMPEGIDWPGWLLSIAIGSAGGGLLISMCVGHKLVGLEVENQKVEAKLRTKLVMLEETPMTIVGTIPIIVPPDTEIDNMVIDNGEFTDISLPRLRPRDVAPTSAFIEVLRELWLNYKRLFANFAIFNCWISLFDQTMIIAPFLLVAPLMFASDPSKRITLGTLMKVSNAFDKVFGAMAIVSENWASVNDFRSTIRRLGEFESSTYARKNFSARKVYNELPERTSSTYLERAAAEISMHSTPL